ncbi:MAG: heavy metal-responsive transcriptional regulator [Sporichthyaceae bacterium]
MLIGELAQASGLTTKTIRFYEERGLIAAPPRTAGGYRDYPEQALGRLRFIRDAQSAGLTLAELRSILALRDGGEAPCEHVGGVIDEHLRGIDRRLADLRATRTVLRSLARRAATVDPATCAEEDVCIILKNPKLSVDS